jgi:hypothetical protein
LQGGPGAFTFVSAIEGVNADGVTLYDSARAEAGPTGGVAITNITHANPGRVTVADVSGFSNGQPVQLSGIVGPEDLNTVTFVRNIDVDQPFRFGN